ncbi:hypothetical protein CBM2605_A190107 [Cupriavidus neocaledonicus]|uniref:Uncharacterized protein n=1 Tax=Cupriavidus neocaledonicus TaxID=1040979 RepID=A0ABY1UZ46_9BURK|nr:hypothetical protein CBM2605_A190107 [Cupriavidus neocaledonicus]
MRNPFFRLSVNGLSTVEKLRQRIQGSDLL